MVKNVTDMFVKRRIMRDFFVEMPLNYTGAPIRLRDTEVFFSDEDGIYFSNQYAHVHTHNKLMFVGTNGKLFAFQDNAAIGYSEPEGFSITVPVIDVVPPVPPWRPFTAYVLARVTYGFWDLNPFDVFDVPRGAEGEKPIRLSWVQEFYPPLGADTSPSNTQEIQPWQDNYLIVSVSTSETHAGGYTTGLPFNPPLESILWSNFLEGYGVPGGDPFPIMSDWVKRTVNYRTHMYAPVTAAYYINQQREKIPVVNIAVR